MSLEVRIRLVWWYGNVIWRICRIHCLASQVWSNYLSVPCEPIHHQDSVRKHRKRSLHWSLGVELLDQGSSLLSRNYHTMRSHSIFNMSIGKSWQQLLFQPNLVAGTWCSRSRYASLKVLESSNVWFDKKKVYDEGLFKLICCHCVSTVPPIKGQPQCLGPKFRGRLLLQQNLPLLMLIWAITKEFLSLLLATVGASMPCQCPGC